MYKYDFHVHSTYCDGKNSLREMVLAAIERGFCAIGFSGHSYTSFDEGWCMSLEGTQAYKEELAALKQEFADKISIFCGIEQDIYAALPQEGYDYAIGSVHYVCADGQYLSVDDTAEEFERIVRECFKGDALSFAEAYFENVGNVLEVTKADIIGHFDLITKFNKANRFFNVNDERYIRAWKKAVDKLIPYGKPFEVNVGAMSRGYTLEPYPSQDILKYIRRQGGRVIFTGDCHSAESLGSFMKEAEDLVKQAGFGGLFEELPFNIK